jgi:hypothetical protein
MKFRDSTVPLILKMDFSVPHSKKVWETLIYTHKLYSWKIKLVASINPHILSSWAFAYFPRNSSHIHTILFIMWNVLEILFPKFSASTAFTSMIYAHWFMIFMSWKGNINYLMIISHKIWFIYKINWYINLIVLINVFRFVLVLFKLNCWRKIVRSDGRVSWELNHKIVGNTD